MEPGWGIFAWVLAAAICWIILLGGAVKAFEYLRARRKRRKPPAIKWSTLGQGEKHPERVPPPGEMDEFMKIMHAEATTDDRWRRRMKV